MGLILLPYFITALALYQNSASCFVPRLSHADDFLLFIMPAQKCLWHRLAEQPHNRSGWSADQLRNALLVAGSLTGLVFVAAALSRSLGN